MAAPEPPYVAVIFTNRLADPGVDDGYAETAERMERLAAGIDGFLGLESVRSADGSGITVSYWRDEQAVAAWRDHPEHREAKARGRDRWYASYELRVARVERARSFPG